MQIRTVTQHARDLQVIGSGNFDGDLASINDERLQGVAE